MLVQPDFTEVQDEVKPGTYKVRVKGGKVETTQNGTTIVNWQLETWGESEPKNNGRSIFYRTPASGKAAFLLQRFYKTAVGQPLTGAFDTEQLIGKQLEVVVGEREYEGRTFTDVKSVNAITA